MAAEESQLVVWAPLASAALAVPVTSSDVDAAYTAHQRELAVADASAECRHMRHAAAACHACSGACLEACLVGEPSAGAFADTFDSPAEAGPSGVACADLALLASVAHSAGTVAFGAVVAPGVLVLDAAEVD